MRAVGAVRGMLWPGPPGQADRDALLYRYTVALASRWPVCGLACGDVLCWGIVSKDDPGNAVGNDGENDGGNAIGSSEPLVRHAWGCPGGFTALHPHESLISRGGQSRVCCWSPVRG